MTEEAPAWAKGFELEFLRECAALYKAEFKQHTYGAFGLPKERDIADARAAGQLVWTKAPAGEIAAVAMFRHAVQASGHSDFADRRATIQPGDLFIRSIAGSLEGKAKLIATMAARVEGATWIEGHVENRALVHLVEGAGFEFVMTKIAASSDLKGLWVRLRDHTAGAGYGDRLPAGLDGADWPGIKVLNRLFLDATDREGVAAELAALDASAWAQHYSSYNKRSSWTSFALAGYDQDDPSFIIKPVEMSKDWKIKNPQRLIASCLPTIFAKRFPAAMRIADRIPGKKQRVRFMRLGAGNGELTRHSDITDPEAGTKDGQIARLHIPIASDPKCVFRSWRLDGREEQLHFPEQALCYIDTRKPHAVINASAIERIHLVIDTHSGPELRRLIAG